MGTDRESGGEHIPASPLTLRRQAFLRAADNGTPTRDLNAELHEGFDALASSEDVVERVVRTMAQGVEFDADTNKALYAPDSESVPSLTVESDCDACNGSLVYGTIKCHKCGAIWRAPVSETAVEAILFRADVPDSGGNIYPASELCKLADNVTKFWDEDRKVLLYRGPMPRTSDSADVARQLADSEHLASYPRTWSVSAAACRYPDCVDNGPDGKCTRWLIGECAGPVIHDKL